MVATEGFINLGGIVGRDIMALAIEADFAIRGGLPEDAALASITTTSARILGVQHRVGSLEIGKDCDLIVVDKDLLHYEAFVQWTVVDGKVVYDKQKELYFAHIRPRPETALAPETHRRRRRAGRDAARAERRRRGEEARRGRAQGRREEERRRLSRAA